MPGMLWAGLALQLLAVTTMLLVFRRGAWRRAGTWLLLNVLVFHGVTEVIQTVTGTRSRGRDVTSTHTINQWTVIAGFAALTFTAGYLIVTALPGKRRATPAPVGPIIGVFNWKILLTVTVPLLLIVSRGGYHFGDLTNYNGTVSASSGLASQFFVLLVTLTAVSFIAAHPRGFLPAFLLELVATVMVGARQDVVVVAVVTLVALALLDRTPRLRSIVTVGIVALLLVLSINSARSIYGRDTYNNAASISQRLTLIRGGLTGLFGSHPANNDAGRSQPLGERLDGNSFPAGELDALHRYVPPVMLTTLGDDAQLTVPSFLNPSKLNTDVASRSEKAYLKQHYDVGFPGDFLPTQFGTLLGYFGVGGLLVLTLLLGMFYGAADRIVATRRTPWRYLLAVALMICAMSYSSAMDTYLLTARGALAVILILKLVDVVRPRLRRRKSAYWFEHDTGRPLAEIISV